jgi:lactoylglutathione lyase
MTGMIGRTVGFGHAGFQVRDLERSRRYYRDIIGLQEIERLTRDEPYLSQAVDPATANPGTGHICFIVDDVDAIHARAVSAGYGSVNPPVTPTAGRWIAGRSVYLLDPDGIRVELVQLGPQATATEPHDRALPA